MAGGMDYGGSYWWYSFARTRNYVWLLYESERSTFVGGNRASFPKKRTAWDLSYLLSLIHQTITETMIIDSKVIQKGVKTIK
jgi:hypothetical protein